MDSGGIRANCFSTSLADVNFTRPLFGIGTGKARTLLPPASLVLSSYEQIFPLSLSQFKLLALEDFEADQYVFSCAAQIFYSKRSSMSTLRAEDNRKAAKGGTTSCGLRLHISRMQIPLLWSFCRVMSTEPAAR